MAIKPIIDIDVKDEAFKNFINMFDEFKKNVGVLPDTWTKFNNEVLDSANAFQGVIDAIHEQTDALAKALSVQAELNRSAGQSGANFSQMESSSKKTSENIFAIGGNLAKMALSNPLVDVLAGAAAITAVAVKTANTVSADRKSAMGLGTSIGELHGFNLAADPYLDSPEGSLGGIAGAMTDYSQQWKLRRLGVPQADIDKGDTTAIEKQALLREQAILKAAPLGNIQTQLSMMPGVSLSDALRLRNAPTGEVDTAMTKEGDYEKKFNITDADAKSWQDFSQSFKAAMMTSSTAMINAFTFATPKMTDLADAAANAAFDVSKFAQELEKALGTDEQQVQPGAHNSTFSPPGGFPPDTQGGASARHNSMFSPRPDSTNPGNLRVPGGSGFQTFSSSDSGVAAIARQLQIYSDRDHLDTISEIENKFAPPSENDTAALIRNAVKETGFGPDQPIDLHNRDQLAAVVAAITKQEGVKTYPRDAVVTIINQTGSHIEITQGAITAVPQ